MKRWWLLVPCLFLLLVGLRAGLHSASADLVQVTPLSPVEHPDGRAGLSYSFYPDPSTGTGRPFIQLAYGAGSRWDRFDFNWRYIEQTAGNYDYGPHDAVVTDLITSGISIVGILQMTPQWAATTSAREDGAEYYASPFEWRALAPRPTTHAPAYPRPDSWVEPWTKMPPQGLYEEWDDWVDTDGDPINYWGRFVHNTVSHFTDVTHWEMWNEAEWDLFWVGSEADYAQLLKIGYLATKDACPDCTVLFAGLHYWDDPTFFEDVLDIINDDPSAAANNYYFDVMSVHLYSSSANTYDIVNHIRSRMQLYVSLHPIWVTETGVPVWGDSSPSVPYVAKYDYAATQDEASNYILQSYANALAAGVERYVFFRTHDSDMANDPVFPQLFGLVRNDLSLRPGYVAYQVAARHLVSPTLTTSWTYGSGVRRVTLWGTPYGKVSVLWNTTPTQTGFEYPAILPSATLIDRWGVSQTITASGGAYSITMPAATANLVSDPSSYFIGGETYLVIEADTAPPTATVHALPTTTYSFTIPVSWEGNDAETDIWLYDIQVREHSSGTWSSWLSMTSADSGGYTGGQHDTQYCFRARAWDSAGNHSAWPASAQACTTLDLERQLHLDLQTVFGDDDASGVMDGAESTITVQLQLLNSAGTDAITPTIAHSWEFTATLPAGDYTLSAATVDWPSPPPGWLPRLLPLNVPPSPDTLHKIIPQFGLLAHRSSIYLPLAMRNTSSE
jgi:hypothetical protein